MDLKELRQWFFEVIGILVPGAISLLLGLAFGHDPAAFGLSYPSGLYYVKALQPFSSDFLNIGLLLGLSYAVGHIVQQLSVYLLQMHSRFFASTRHSFIQQVFDSEAIRNFLIPQESQLESSIDLKANDYFMMVYPDLAQKTKRETFISISGFCGAMAVVSLAGVLFLGVAKVLQIWRDSHMTSGSLIVTIFTGLMLTVIWIQRCRYFHDMADRVVANYFLFQFGAYFRGPGQETGVSE